MGGHEGPFVGPLVRLSVKYSIRLGRGYCIAFPAQSPRIRAIPAQAFRASLFSHLLSRDGINKSMDPALTGLWCPPASYFSSCQSQRTHICWNTLMHCVTPWQMFIKLFFNEKQGSIADRGDSCIPTPCICADLS